MDLKKTGLFIATLRKQNGMTQKELGEKIGVTDKAVSRWETGKGFPDVSLLPVLAESLSVSVSEIVMGEKIEIEEKKAVDIMEKMNQTVMDTLDYSQREINKNKWKGIAIPISVLLFSGIILYSVFRVVYEELFWTQTPSVPIGDVLYVLLSFIAIPVVVPFFINSIKNKYSWITPRKSLWLSPLAAFALVMATTAFLFPSFYRDLVNIDFLLYDFGDTAVHYVLFFIVPINLLLTFAISAIFYANNKIKAHKNDNRKP